MTKPLLTKPLLTKPLSPREAALLAALSGSFERTWDIAARAGLTGPKAAETALTFLAALANRGLAEHGGTRADTKWRRIAEGPP